MTPTTSRRAFVTGLAGAAMTSAVHDRASSAEAHVDGELGSPEDFSFPGLREKARRLAAEPFVPASPPFPEILAKIGFDEYQRIRFRQDRTFFLGSSDQYPVQLFHLGRY